MEALAALAADVRRLSLKKKIITIFIIVLIGIASSLIASFYTNMYLNKTYAITMANASLYDLSYVMDAIEELQKSKPVNPIVLEKLEIILVASLVSIKSINPEISKLQGTPLNTLCRIINYNDKKGILKKGMGPNQNKELTELATSYLKRIEPLLREIANNSCIPFYECNDHFGIEKEYKILKEGAF